MHDLSADLSHVQWTAHSREEAHIAGILIFLVAVIGIVVNYSIIVLISQVASLSNAFGWLTLNQVVAEGALLTLFGFYFAPTVFFSLDALKVEDVSKVFGHMTILCSDVGMYAHVVVSLNRVIAVYNPHVHNLLFTKHNTQIIIFICWAIPLLHTTGLYIFEGCGLIYSDLYWSYRFVDSPICTPLWKYCDFMRNTVLAFLVVVLDIVSYLRIRSESKKDSLTVLGPISDQVNFVRQICAQGILFVIELNWYLFFANLFANKWYKFFSSTFFWLLLYTLDGFVTLTFNKGFGQIISVRMLQLLTMSPPITIAMSRCSHTRREPIYRKTSNMSNHLSTRLMNYINVEQQSDTACKEIRNEQCVA